MVNQPNRIPFWRRLGGGSLTISIIIHAVVLVLGLFWILNVIPPEKEKVVDFRSSGGKSAGAPGPQSEKKRNVSQNRSIQRVAAVNISSSMALPDPVLDAGSALQSLGSLGGSMGAGGLGGSGNGGGIGHGDGLGPGMAPGPVPQNPFGMLSRNPTGLVGTFYDLKQDTDRKSTGISNERTLEVIRDFVTRGWKESMLSKSYFQAPQKLSQTKIYIPAIRAEGAPAAFNCEKEVQPSRWIIVYRGSVTPAKAGRYRFVGAADDVLVVRFNDKHVFDHGYFGGTTGMRLSGNMVKVLKGEEKDRDRERSLKDSPMKIPVGFYNYDSTRNQNQSIGGLAVGPWFEARPGVEYPIDILLSEIPGGIFSAALMIEREGDSYEKASTGAPILPVFRLDRLETEEGDNAPPVQKDGPSWKIVERRAGLLDR